MALFSFVCENTKCDNYEKIVKRIIKGLSEKQYCSLCGEELRKIFNFQGRIDMKKGTRDVGKIIQEKNESLKKKWTSYSYEQQSLREKITNTVNSFIKNKV